MKLEMGAPPLPPSFPLDSFFPLLPSPPTGAWGAHKLKPRAGPTAGQSSREAALGAGALTLGGGMAPPLCQRQWSQDEAMSDGWNHAGRSVKTGESGLEVVTGGELQAIPCPMWSRGTDLGQNIPCRRVGSSGWQFLLLLGWATEKNKKLITGTRENAGRCGQETDTEHVCGQGRQKASVRNLESGRQKQSHEKVESQ